MFGDASFVLPCETEHLAGAFTRRSMRRLWIVRQSWARSCRMGARNRALVSRKKKNPDRLTRRPGQVGPRGFRETKRTKLENQTDPGFWRAKACQT